MTDEISNDNHAAPTHGARADPDPHGQAAMLLVESLIHGLIARSVITTGDAVEIVDIAADVKVEMAIGHLESTTTMRKSLVLLEAISASLEHDR